MVIVNIFTCGRAVFHDDSTSDSDVKNFYCSYGSFSCRLNASKLNGTLLEKKIMIRQCYHELMHLRAVKFCFFSWISFKVGWSFFTFSWSLDFKVFWSRIFTKSSCFHTFPLFSSKVGINNSAIHELRFSVFCWNSCAPRIKYNSNFIFLKN